MKAYEEYESGDVWPPPRIEANPFYRRELSILSRTVGTAHWKSVLDLGAGYGRAAQAVASQAERLILLDGSPRMLRLARGRTGNRLALAADINARWPVRDASFELVVGLQILNHAEDLGVFFSELRRVLTAGGSAVLSFGNAHSWIEFRQRRRPTLKDDGFRRLTLEAVRQAARSEGFSFQPVGGSGLFSPHRRLRFLDVFNRWDVMMRYCHLIVARLKKPER
jgi:SAM-dependent methyltransferase